MIKRNFPCTMATLLYDGDLILTAAEKQPEMAKKRLEDGLLTTARGRWTSLGGKGGSAGADSSATGALTKQQDTAIITLLDLFGRAKESAKKALKGQETKLTGEFTVGENAPRDLASILKRAKTVRDACQDSANAAVLKSGGGWIADDTTALDTAIAQVGEIDKQQLASISVEIAGTDARNTAANTFYNNLLTIQSAANNEWPESNANNRATRGDFRLGQFPPPSKKKAAATAGVIKSPGNANATTTGSASPAATPA